MKVSIISFSPERSSNNKGEVGCTPTSKLNLIQLVEIEEKLFSKDIMRSNYWRLKVTPDIPTTNWFEAEWRQDQLEAL